MPSVLPWSPSALLYSCRSHLPARIDATASGMRRSSETIRPSTSSATADAFLPGTVGHVDAVLACGAHVDRVELGPGTDDEVQVPRGEDGGRRHLGGPHDEDPDALQALFQAFARELGFVDDLERQGRSSSTARGWSLSAMSKRMAPGGMLTESFAACAPELSSASRPALGRAEHARPPADLHRRAGIGGRFVAGTVDAGAARANPARADELGVDTGPLGFALLTTA